jgi:hypothetical protein
MLVEQLAFDHHEVVEVEVDAPRSWDADFAGVEAVTPAVDGAWRSA